MRIILVPVLILFQIGCFAQHCIPERYSEVAIFDSTEIVIQTDLQYGVAQQYFTGQQVNLLMDVYYPDQSIDQLAERPVILNIHGGGFIGGDKNELSYQSIEFARRGFVVANINYRVGWNCDNVICFNCYGSNMQKAIYSAVQDARTAMRFVHDQKEEWGIDEDWMFINGQSAGSIMGMQCTFWNQEEADNQVEAGFSAVIGGLDDSGNDLIGTFQVKALIDQCGAIANLGDTDDNLNLPIIGFHDSNDCVVPYNGGSLIACFCSGFLSYYGSNSIHLYRQNAGECTELHTAPQPLLPNHCTYPQINVVKLSSCFLKRVMCGFCINFSDDDIYATPICSGLTNTVVSIPGCTYTIASNYDPAATLDNGSCIFNSSCAADLDQNGIVGVSDLIEFIGVFGTVCE